MAQELPVRAGFAAFLLRVDPSKENAMKILGDKSFLAILMVSILALAGCGGATPSPTGTTEPSVTSTTIPTSLGTVSPTATSELSTMMSGLGEVIVGKNQMTVYYFTKDEKDSGRRNCSNECLINWPPVYTDSSNPTLDGKITGKVGTVTVEDGKKQVTINGMPVYYYVKDLKPGDVKGQDVAGSWYVISPDGKMVKDTSKSEVPSDPSTGLY